MIKKLKESYMREGLVVSVDGNDSFLCVPNVETDSVSIRKLGSNRFVVNIPARKLKDVGWAVEATTEQGRVVIYTSNIHSQCNLDVVQRVKQFWYYEMLRDEQYALRHVYGFHKWMLDNGYMGNDQKDMSSFASVLPFLFVDDKGTFNVITPWKHPVYKYDTVGAVRHAVNIYGKCDSLLDELSSELDSKYGDDDVAKKEWIAENGFLYVKDPGCMYDSTGKLC